MTYEDDFVQFKFPGGTTVRYTCRKLGIDWPPPIEVEANGVRFIRDSFSQITDADRADMTHVCRGASYIPKKTVTHQIPQKPTRRLY